MSFFYLGTANTEYSYDLLNRLTQIQQATDQPDVFNNIEYTYGNSGLRTSKVVNTQATDFVNDGSNIVYEKKYDTATPENISTATYIRGINLICKIEAGAKYFYLYNGHGDVIQIVDNLGNVVNNYNYDEWGNILEENETIQNPFKYAGEYFDNETGYIYLRARYYDPAIGRFINEDSYWGKDNDPLSLNLYTYCGNNPIAFIDPSGNVYILSWSYGRSDLADYTNNKGEVDWDTFTKENSFARAAYTKRNHLIEHGIKEDDIVVRRIDSEDDLKAAWMEWQEYSHVDQLHMYSHGSSDGPIMAGGGGSQFLLEAPRLNFGSSLYNGIINGKSVGIISTPYVVFYGCNTANGDFAQNFSNSQKVGVYGKRQICTHIVYQLRM